MTSYQMFHSQFFFQRKRKQSDNFQIRLKFDFYVKIWCRSVLNVVDLDVKLYWRKLLFHSIYELGLLFDTWWCKVRPA